jgi:hypothetical protein
MGSAAGSLAAAANRVGLTVTEYQDRVNAGLRWCFRDQAWESAESFGKDSSRTDGLARSCRRSTNAASRRNYLPKGRPKPGRRFAPARDGDKVQARRRIDHLINIGLLPDPNELPCSDCGHRTGPGERRHEYDHHLGYDAEHHEDVEAVCTTCHYARERERGVYP